MLRKLPAKRRLQLLPLAAQGPLGHLCLGDGRLQLFLPLGQAVQRLLLPPDLLLQLRLAGGELLPGRIQCGCVHIGRQLPEQLVPALLQGGARRPSGQALLLGLLPGFLPRLLGCFQLRLSGRVAGQLGRGRVMERTAYRAGLSLCQGLGQ